MKKKKLLLQFICLVLPIAFLIILKVNGAHAASLSNISDTLSRIEVAVDANHTIEFVTPTGVNESTDTIVITLDDSVDSFDLTGVVYSDMDLAIDNDGNCDGTWTDKNLASSAGAGTWGVNVNTSTDVITFTAPTDASTGEIPAGYCVQIEIGTNASGGVNMITNPALAQTYIVDIAGTFGDQGAYSIAIVTDDQIDISASVDPTLEVIIGSNSCVLGTLSATYIETCSYDVTVSTNAAQGYVSSLVGDGLLRNSISDINNASGDTVVRGAEEYGVGTSKAGQTIVQNAACTDHDNINASQPASPVLTTAQQFANAVEPVSSDLTTVCHLASVSGATPAGSYSQVVTIIVTANY